jgi:predicted NBD/HSP70 family sugar kinase
MKKASNSTRKSLTVPDTANANLQNRINTSIIFNYLRDHGFAYRAQIARDLGISAPAVSRAIEKLRRDEYVIESERVPVENGKRAAHISINAGHGYVLGIDLMTDPVEIAVSDFSGTILYTHLGKPVSESSDFSAYLLDTIHGCLAAFQEKVPGREARVLAIGIGVPAVVDPRTGAILRASLYERIARTNIKADVQAQFPVPIYVENVSNLAAIGEWKRGVNRNVRNMLFLELGNGIGAGIIMDGDLYRGAEGSAGEIGYFLTELGGLGHDNTHIGFLESMASLGAIRGKTAEAATGDVTNGAYPSIAALCEAAFARAEPAATFFRDMVRHLAVATVNIMLLLNPEIVIVGGAVCGLPHADSLILQPLAAEVARNYPLTPAIIQKTSLGEKANIIGAVQFALDSFLIDMYPYRL